MKADLSYSYIITTKNNKYYVVFDFKDKEGNRKRKWVNTALSKGCLKKELKEREQEIVSDFRERLKNAKTQQCSSVKNPTKLNRPIHIS